MSTNLEIMTPSGYQVFDGIKRYWHESFLRVYFDKGHVDVAAKHRFIGPGGVVLYADKLVSLIQSGTHADFVSGAGFVKRVEVIDSGDWFYDPVNVENGSIYNHDDGIVSHNTFFGTGDTLISPDCLLSLRSHKPIYERGDGVYIYEETAKNHQYVMLVDVAKGRGQDYSTFNVIDITVSPWKQVAVYRSNLISPILFPDIIYKYANVYNEALVVIESNDAGQVVCVGLYHDLEYENMYVESAVKHNALGVNMDRKVKRIGCSTFKDIIETGKLELVDANTISECSTFVAKGQSYEASDGNHDDLVMNFVLLGYFVGTNYFGDMANINLKQHLFEKSSAEIEADMLPFGFIDDGSDHIQALESREPYDEWLIKDHTRDNWNF